MIRVEALVCSGRPVDDTGQPAGEPCGRRLSPLPGNTAEDLVQRARAGGWAVSDPPRPGGSRDVMCPRCRRPDPEIARGLTTT